MKKIQKPQCEKSKSAWNNWMDTLETATHSTYEGVVNGQ